MKNNALKYGIRALAFLLIFLTLLTMFTLIFLPKRDGETRENAQPAGFYREPANTLDVLFLGSCNMYSSVSPVLLYEEYGITGYAFCCPDEEMSTSYYYLKEALKKQDLKAVVVESLFLTQTNGKNREHYNRLAFDYFPLNLNKIRLAAETSKRESELMRQYDSTAPDTLLTFAGYIFPLLRYHNRDDLSREDLTFFLENDLYNFYKGGFPQYNYTTNDGNFFDKVFNGSEINEMSRKYIPMIKALCDEHNIPLIIVKSPNYARWGYDDAHTKPVREFAAEVGAQFLDFQGPELNNFEIYDYGYQTGRLNVYGVKKFTSSIGRFLTEVDGLEPTVLSEKDRETWDACVEKYYRVAKEKKANLYPGQIAQLSNLDGAIRVRWNVCEDSRSYSVYRSVEKSDSFTLLADGVTGETYNDTDVVPGQGYTYYVVPQEGKMAGQASESAYYVYVDMPQGFKATNDDGALRLSWKKSDAVSFYRIQRRYSSDFNFSYYDYSNRNSYVNQSVTDGYLYYYRVLAVYKKDGAEYTSMSTIARQIPQTTPMITGISSSGGSVTLSWKALKNQDSVQIWRRAADAGEFTLIGTVKGSTTKYTDKSVEGGSEYFYQIVSDRTVFGYSSESEPSNTVGVKVPK